MLLRHTVLWIVGISSWNEHNISIPRMQVVFFEISISTYKTVPCHRQKDETVGTSYTGIQIWKFYSQIETIEIKIEPVFPG